jgi:hypothetical protein
VTFKKIISIIVIILVFFVAMVVGVGLISMVKSLIM